MGPEAKPKGWPRHLVAPGSGLPIGWSILDGSAPLPLLTVDAGAMAHNITSMAAYCAERGMSLAPHGKTTMSPEIIRMQLDAGAWAITAATAWQVATMADMGVPRILLANELIDAGSIRLIADLLQSRPLEFLCYVDSPESVRALARHIPATLKQPIDVLIEVGHEQGRTGARTDEAVWQTVGEVRDHEQLRLVGVSGYEGTIPHGDGLPLKDIDAFARRLVDLVLALHAAGVLNQVDEAIVTAGGSMYADRVSAALAPLVDRRPSHRADGSASLERPAPAIRVVLRSGVYVLHDHGAYAADSSFGARGRSLDEPSMQPALRIWSVVLSVPEPGLALLNFGKRDVGFDLGMPIPLSIYRDGSLHASLEDCIVSSLSDQHAFLRWPGRLDPRPGDIVACGISHPCTTLDRWQAVPLIDADLQVIDAITTRF